MDLTQLLNSQNGTGGATIPGLEGLQSMLGTITILSVVLGGLFLILYVINVIQRMRADRAMIAMHKDIAAIRTLLEQGQAPAPTTAPVAPASNPIRDESGSSLATPEHTS